MADREVLIVIECGPRWFWRFVRPFAQVAFALLPLDRREPFAAWLARWCWRCSVKR